MITLALDTSGPWCTCAIVAPDTILSNPSEKIGRGHAERLAPMVAKAIDLAGIEARDINRVAIVTGPGSFTGLRVALAFGRSFALPRKLPVLGVSALQAMAAVADPEQNRKIVSAINAKRGDICWAYYENGRELLAPRTMPVEDARKAIDELVFDLCTGDGCDLLGRLPVIDHVSGPVLGWMSEDLDSAEYAPEPFYARGPDAKLPGGKSP